MGSSIMILRRVSSCWIGTSLLIGWSDRVWKGLANVWIAWWERSYAVPSGDLNALDAIWGRLSGKGTKLFQFKDGFWVDKSSESSNELIIRNTKDYEVRDLSNSAFSFFVLRPWLLQVWYCNRWQDLGWYNSFYTQIRILTYIKRLLG